MIDAACDNGPALLRLLQLASPALPVGAYAYSQGLEYAVHAGWLRDEETVAEWILNVMTYLPGRVDVPVLARLYRAWRSGDDVALDHWSGYLRACRESRELQDEDRQTGAALARLLRDLGVTEAVPWVGRSEVGFAVSFALAATRWQVPVAAAAQGYLWSWAENQTAAAIKLVPLGQTAGQRILSRVSQSIPVVVADGLALGDDEIGFVAQRLAIGSALHEHQYSRLFRS